MKRLTLTNRILSTILLVLLAIGSSFSQNPDDSEESNEGGYEKDWTGFGWVLIVILVLIAVGFFVYQRRKKNTTLKRNANYFKDQNN
jgi:LPXTG-motif cell wall-anchored protein